MAASLDGFIARKDGSVDWMETADRFDGGETMTPELAARFLADIDCYVMGSKTYETAERFASAGAGWAYGDKPTFVFTTRELTKVRDSVEFYSGDLTRLVNDILKPRFSNIWFVGGARLAAECLARGLADEVRYTILPVAIGSGISFFRGLDADVGLHLVEHKAYDDGTVALRYDVRKQTPSVPA